MICFEPFKALNMQMYKCDKKFHVEELKELLEHDAVYGFIVVDGGGACYATIQGSAKEVIKTFNVTLPKKHKKGGQSSARFGRIRMNKRKAYVKKVCEIATEVFIRDGERPNIEGLVIAGAAEFKEVIEKSAEFDPRLKNIVQGIIDVQYGGENGLNQAINDSRQLLGNVRFVKEKGLINKFMGEIA
jgi:peptide chain release factor subunit 1